jgi:hypothetical protein
LKGHHARASVRPMSIQSHSIRNKSWVLALQAKKPRKQNKSIHNMMTCGMFYKKISC